MIDVAAGMKLAKSVSGLFDSLDATQRATLDEVPSLVARLVKSRASDQESVASFVDIMESDAPFVEKVMTSISANAWQPALNALRGKPVVSDPADPKESLVRLRSVLDSLGKCPECNAFSTVEAFVDYDPNRVKARAD